MCNVLFLVSVDGQRRPAVLTKVFGNVVCYSLCTNEDENLGALLGDLIQVLDELGPLLEIAANFDDLGNVMIRSELHRSDVHLNEVFQEVLRAGDQYND